MYDIPAMAIITANQVIVRTFSPKIKNPRIAVINGAVANRSMAFATDVV